MADDGAEENSKEVRIDNVVETADHVESKKANGPYKVQKGPDQAKGHALEPFAVALPHQRMSLDVVVITFSVHDSWEDSRDNRRSAKDEPVCARWHIENGVRHVCAWDLRGQFKGMH